MHAESALGRATLRVASDKQHGVVTEGPGHVALVVEPAARQLQVAEHLSRREAGKVRPDSHRLQQRQLFSPGGGARVGAGFQSERDFHAGFGALGGDQSANRRVVGVQRIDTQQDAATDEEEPPHHHAQQEQANLQRQRGGHQCGGAADRRLAIGAEAAQGDVAEPSQCQPDRQQQHQRRRQVQRQQYRCEQHGDGKAAAAEAGMRARHPSHQRERQHVQGHQVVAEVHHAAAEGVRADNQQQHRQQDPERQ